MEIPKGARARAKLWLLISVRNPAIAYLLGKVGTEISKTILKTKTVALDELFLAVHSFVRNHFVIV